MIWYNLSIKDIEAFSKIEKQCFSIQEVAL